MDIKKEKDKNLIIGIGNILMQDDGIGVHFVESIKNDFPDFEIVGVGSLDFSILEELENRDCVVFVDALEENCPEAHVFLELKESNSAMKFSFHEVGLRDFVGVLRILGKEPNKMFLFGLKPYSLNPGIGLSDEMEEKLPFLRAVFKKFMLEYGIEARREMNRPF